MKKLLKNLFFFGAVGSVAILASCGGDDEPVLPAQPSIEVDVTGIDGTEAQPGDTVTFTVNMDVPGTFNVLRVVGMDGETEVYSEEFPRGNAAVTANADNTEATVVIAIGFDADNVGQEIEFEFEVVDDSDQTATTTETVTVVSPAARSYTTVLLYAPLEDKSADAFFSTNTGATYSPDSVNATEDPLSADVDFGYYYGATNGATIASVAEYAELSVAVFAAQVAGWGTKNGTTFKETTLDASAFTEVTTWADIDAVYEEAEGDGSGIVTNLAVDQVVAFETDPDKEGGAKRGLILVKAIDGTFNQGDNIELEILVQGEVED